MTNNDTTVYDNDDMNLLSLRNLSSHSFLQNQPAKRIPFREK